MRQFWAILKDSFREAVDGFVIYVMLALSAVVILIVGSMSFTPTGPEDALPKIVQGFSVVIPEKGQSRMMTMSSESFKASDVRAEGNGYRLRVTVKAQPNVSVGGPDGVMKPDPTKGDSFRRTVVGWAKPGGKGRQFEQGGKKFELGESGAASEREQVELTDAQLEAFIQNQFAVHAGMDSTVKRVKDGVEEPTYAFDVATSGGSSVAGWPHTVKIFFGAVTFPEPLSLGMMLWVIEDRIINGMGAAIALLISLIITSFFIPNMLRKGSIDLLVSKPIGRTQLLLYKYVGGLTFIFLLSCVSIGGVWLVLAARSGYWDPTFLIVIPILTFTFAILYAVSTLVAVLTRSPIAAMLLSVGFAVFLYIVGKTKEVVDVLKVDGDRVPEWVVTLVDTVNNVLPRYKDLDKLTSKLLSTGTLTPGELRMTGQAFLDYPSWGGTFGVSLAFIAVMLALSCWRFSRRDY